MHRYAIVFLRTSQTELDSNMTGYFSERSVHPFLENSVKDTLIVKLSGILLPGPSKLV